MDILTDTLTNNMHRQLNSGESIWYWKVAQVATVIVVTCIFNNFIVKKQLSHTLESSKETLLDDSYIINKAVAIAYKTLVDYLPTICGVLSLSICLYLLYSKNNNTSDSKTIDVNSREINKTNSQPNNLKKMNKKLLKLEQNLNTKNQKLISDGKNINNTNKT